jgi:hypothetical protein
MGMFCRSLFVRFLFAIVLSVLHRFTYHDNHFGIFKLLYDIWSRPLVPSDFDSKYKESCRLSNVFGAICYEFTEMFLLSNTCPAGCMQVIIGRHVVPLESKLLLIALALVRIALNVHQMHPICQLSNGVSIVQKLVFKLSNISIVLFPPVAKTLSKCLRVWQQNGFQLWRTFTHLLSSWIILSFMQNIFILSYAELVISYA